MTPNPAAAPSDLDLERLADLSARYASYSRSAGGLSSVIGGALCALTFVVGALLPLDQALRYALASAPLLWLASKEALRHFYYQRAGLAAERISPKQQRLRRWMTIYLGVMALLIIAGVVQMAAQKDRLPQLLQGPALAYLAIVAALPVIAHRWFWSVSDFLVGVLLFCQAAVVLVGIHYPAPWILIAASFSLIAISTGIREHRDYLQLRRELGLDGAGVA